MSTIFQVSQTWPLSGFAGIKHIVIFGDSYSSVGYSVNEPNPTPSNPLGVPYPGEDLWTDVTGDDNFPELQPNWVGALISKYVPGQKYIPRNQTSSILVYDFAIGGDTVSGVGHQISYQFISHMGQKPDWASWAPEDTLFITWVGINDLAFATHPPSLLTKLFQFQKNLYEVGARNFLFIDCPPIDRSPAALARFANNASNKSMSRYADWNAALGSSISSFASKFPEATTLMFSSHLTFTRVLDDPVGHGFHEEGAARKAGRGIWMDHLHPTSRMHDVVAKDLGKFLETVVNAGSITP